MLGSPRRRESARAFRWGRSYKGLELAQLLGRCGAFLTLVRRPGCEAGRKPVGALACAAGIRRGDTGSLREYGIKRMSGGTERRCGWTLPGRWQPPRAARRGSQRRGGARRPGLAMGAVESIQTPLSIFCIDTHEMGYTKRRLNDLSVNRSDLSTAHGYQGPAVARSRACRRRRGR